MTHRVKPVPPSSQPIQSANTKLTEHAFCDLGLAVLETEMDAIAALRPRIDENFANACQHLLDCDGRVVVIGMGKSGHIGNKIAATLASTGTPAFFVHPGEACHGDMGMVTRKDVVIAISYSGETDELLTLLPLIKRLEIPLISLSGNPESRLALAATINIDISVEKEACPLGLAPTASTTATLAMGDALAIALLEARGFTANDFAMSHPGGNLGRRLLLYVSDLMHTGNKIPQISPNTLLPEALLIMTQKGLGMTAIIDENNILLGIFTDGDLRRTLDRDMDIRTTKIDSVMTNGCLTIQEDMLAAEALELMESKKITSLVVIESEQKIKGIIHIHDILQSGLT